MSDTQGRQGRMERGATGAAKGDADSGRTPAAELPNATADVNITMLPGDASEVSRSVKERMEAEGIDTGEDALREAIRNAEHVGPSAGGG